MKLDLPLLTMIIVLILCILFMVKFGFADEVYTNEQIVNAIFKAEGSYKAQYLYGIRSVKYKGKQQARRICLNTVRNNRLRYKQYGYRQYDTYLQFLASRYCPIGCDNDNGTNKYWLRNVKYFLNK